MEVDLHLNPSLLALLLLYQGVAMALAGPIWGNLTDSGCFRKVLLMLGAASWGICTLLLSFVSSFTSMAVLRTLSGVFLGSLMPVLQSYVADNVPTVRRGHAFGLICFFTYLGNVVSYLVILPISETYVLGMVGWRFAFIAIGLLSFVIVFMLAVFADCDVRDWRPDRLGIGQELDKIRNFLSTPTFGVLVVQGICGVTPGAALSFGTMYFQYSGLSNSTCTFINVAQTLGGAIGGLVGGYIGDAWHRSSPHHGRAFCAQLSVLLSLPCVYVLFVAEPSHEFMAFVFGFLYMAYQFAASWVEPGCINPMVCDVIPQSAVASAIAWEVAIVYFVGNSLGPLLAGNMAGQFGYKLSIDTISTMDEASRVRNAKALGQMLVILTIIPTVASGVLMSLLHLTYPRDMDAMQDQILGSSNYGSTEDSGSGKLA